MRGRCVVAVLLALGQLAVAQVPVSQTPPGQTAPLPQQPGGVIPGGVTQAGDAATVSPDIRGRFDQLRPSYILRPGDQILIRAFEMDEIGERPYRIDGDGYINLPVLGKTRAGGLSVEQLEASLLEAMKKYVRVPQISVTVTQFSSEPVFFVGAFKAPGIYPLGGQRNLVEMIAAVGGLLPTASRRIKVTRRKEFGAIPLPGAITSPDGSSTSIEVNMASLQNNVNPAEDIILGPFDVISVERAEMIYVAGSVGRIGALDLQEKDSISVIQALTLAGGLTSTADARTAYILRPVSNTSRRAQITLNLERILKAQDTDKPLLPNDVLYVPKSSSLKRDLGRTIQIGLPITFSVISLIITLIR